MRQLRSIEVVMKDDPESGEMLIEVLSYRMEALTTVETVKYDPYIPSKFSPSR